MARSTALLVSAFLALAPLASADGLYLNLKSENPNVKAGEAARVRLEVVATIDARLPGDPVFLVSNNGGESVALAASAAKTVEAAAATRVTPGKALRSSYELTLPGPGAYKVRARYQLANRLAESNKVKIVVAE